MSIAKDAERAADYLKALARAGQELPWHLIVALSANLRMSYTRARRAKDYLLINKRLNTNRRKNIPSIDGVFFMLTPEADDVSIIKDCLRRYFVPVVDVRTIEEAWSVAHGRPITLLVGAQRIPFEAAIDLARTKAAEAGIELGV